MAKATERPYVSFREVKERVPIPDALEKLGIADQFTERNGVYTGICPIHPHGPRPNRQQFKINQRDGVWLWHCFGDCQRGGDVVELVKSVTGLSDEHVRFWFFDNFGERLSSGKPGRRADDTKRAGGEVGQKHPAPASSETTRMVSSEESSGKLQSIRPLKFHLKLEPCEYLRERGVSDETQATFGCGLCNRGYLQGYAAFPLYRYRLQPLTPKQPVPYSGSGRLF